MRDDIADKLELHRQWLYYNKMVDSPMDSISKPGDPKPPRGVKANFFGVNMDDVLLPEYDFSGAYMSRARMQGADLHGAKLIGTDLSYAKLRGANFALARLNEADLSEADLRDANLSWVNLQSAVMTGAQLAGANICYAVGNGREIKNLHPATPDAWWLTYTATHMSIGCNLHPLEDWWVMSDEDIRAMAPGALKLWRVNKQPIMDAITAFPAEEYG